MSQVRDAIESLYIGKCTIVEFVPEKDEETKLTTQVEKQVYVDLPCRLSYSRYKTEDVASGTEFVSAEQTMKLFLSPDIEVNHGSKLIITQNGKTKEYKRSGVANHHTNHQEIPIQIYEKA